MRPVHSGVATFPAMQTCEEHKCPRPQAQGTSAERDARVGSICTSDIVPVVGYAATLRSLLDSLICPCYFGDKGMT